MDKFHILNGDCLAEKIPKDLEGEKIIWRECLVQGTVSEKNFFEIRSKFIQENFGESNEGYLKKVLKEFQKIKNIPENSKVYFWFEDDLFCQVNFWFLLSQFNFHNNLFAVFPLFKDENERWKGFGNHDSEDLKNAFISSKQIKNVDFVLAKNLWKAFSETDLKQLKLLSKSKSEIFRKLSEVITANKNQFNRTLEKQIFELAEHETNFNKLFQKFSEKYGVYGFGDLQFKMYLPQPQPQPQPQP